jgi:hypothetical protein
MSDNEAISSLSKDLFKIFDSDFQVSLGGEHKIPMSWMVRCIDKAEAEPVMEAPPQNTLIPTRRIAPTPMPPLPTRRDSEFSELSRADLLRRLGEAEQEVVRLTNANQKLLQEWQETAANLAEVKATVGYTLDDGHFTATWLGLQYQVKNWAMEHFGPSTGSFLGSIWRNLRNPSPILPEVSTYWKEYVKSNDHRPLLVQAVVWHLLQKHVFAVMNNEGSKHTYGAYWALWDQPTIAKLNDTLRVGRYNTAKLKHWKG